MPTQQTGPWQRPVHFGSGSVPSPVIAIPAGSTGNALRLYRFLRILLSCVLPVESRPVRPSRESAFYHSTLWQDCQQLFIRTARQLHLPEKG